MAPTPPPQDVSARFRQRVMWNFLAGLGLLALWSTLFMLRERLPQQLVGGVLVLIPLAMLGVRLTFWRCPACSTRLRSRRAPPTCPQCGARLLPAS
jgi:hypothetical protein